MALYWFSGWKRGGGLVREGVLHSGLFGISIPKGCRKLFGLKSNLGTDFTLLWMFQVVLWALVAGWFLNAKQWDKASVQTLWRAAANTEELFVHDTLCLSYSRKVSPVDPTRGPSTWHVQKDPKSKIAAQNPHGCKKSQMDLKSKRSTQFQLKPASDLAHICFGRAGEMVFHSPEATCQESAFWGQGPPIHPQN